MATMPVQDLLKTHADYDPVIDKDRGLRALQTYSDFYHGGRKFSANKNKYLRRRPIESQQGGADYRKNRLQCANYTSHIKGIGTNLCGVGLQNPPKFEVAPDKDGKIPDRAKYWLDINQNMDGRGRDSRTIAWEVLESVIVHRRGYWVVDFPQNDGNATFCYLDAKCVDDWDCDEYGNYLFIRTHVVDLTRSKKFGPQDSEKHTWTFFSKDEIIEYVATRPIGGNWPDDAVASSTTTDARAHGLKEIPVFPVEVPDDFWLMDQVYETCNAYFNREATRSFSIDTGALTLPVLKSNKDVNRLVLANGFCIKIDPGDDFLWRSPDGAIYAALKEDCEYHRENLYMGINQMALQASSQAGNARMSGTKSTADSHSIKAFLGLLCNPVMAGLRKAMKAVQAYREDDDLDLTCTGMANFDVQSIELEINRCISFTSIPAAPPEWRKESVRECRRAYLPNMTQDKIEKGEEEMEEMQNIQNTQPQIDMGGRMPEVVQSGESPNNLLNKTTGRPQGQAPGQVSQQYKVSGKKAAVA